MRHRCDKSTVRQRARNWPPCRTATKRCAQAAERGSTMMMRKSIASIVAKISTKGVSRGVPLTVARLSHVVMGAKTLWSTCRAESDFAQRASFTYFAGEYSLRRRMSAERWSSTTCAQPAHPPSWQRCPRLGCGVAPQYLKWFYKYSDTLVGSDVHR